MKRQVDWHHIDPGKPVQNVFIESWRHQDLLLCGSDLRGGMKRFIESTLLPECLDDWIDDDNPIRVIDAFVEPLNLAELGFAGVEPETTGRPSYHPSVLLKLYIYGYLNRVQSSRRLEREAGRPP